MQIGKKVGDYLDARSATQS